MKYRTKIPRKLRPSGQVNKVQRKSKAKFLVVARTLRHSESHPMQQLNEQLPDRFGLPPNVIHPCCSHDLQDERRMLLRYQGLYAAG